MNLLENLNENQKQAVMETEGPVMVMAGAGSGKTKVLTTRISYIIQELGIAPSQILAVTFTNKAAQEMKSRIESMLGIDTRFMWISTFHSFCARLLRLEIDKLEPFTKNFTIIDEEDSLKLVKECLKELDIDIEVTPAQFRKYISKSKNFSNFKIKDSWINDYFTTINRRYEEKCKENNLLDFDDLIIYTLKLFRKYPDVLEKYQEKFNYILVDEFQDTNDLQYELVCMLSGLHNNLFVVGDDFQSIYSFRGAKIENINKFLRDFKDNKLILLEQNYRSTTPILNLANDIIKKNPNQIKKEMFTNREGGKTPYFFRAEDAKEEALFVAEKISEKVKMGMKYSDFAIMYRSNYISRTIETTLKEHHIPYVIYGGTSFFSRTEVKDMIAYLRLLVNPNDDFSFLRIINTPKRGIGQSILDKLNSIKFGRNISLYDSIDYYEGSGKGATNLRSFKATLERIKEDIEKLTLEEILKRIFEDFDYASELIKDEDTYQDRVDNIGELASMLVESDESNEEEGLSNESVLEKILVDLALRTDKEEEKDKDCVKVTTFHQVKGLEFPVVFMVAMDEGIFPNQQAMIFQANSSEMEEERRICYVGITRAKDELYLTSAKERTRYGKYEQFGVSSFIKEMNHSLYCDIRNTIKNNVSIPIKKINVEKKVETVKSDSSQVSFSIGDKINHKVFGDGMIVKIEGDIINVAFPSPTGIKKLKANHPSIRKL